MSNNTRKKVRVLAEGAIMLGMAFVLSYVRLFRLPWGGSVTLMSMLPIIVYSIKRGAKSGLFAAFVFSLIQLGQGIAVDGLLGWGLTPAMLISCIMLDYIGAYTVIGVGGIFREKGLSGWISGTVLAIFLRYVCHVISGALIFHSAGMLWGNFGSENQWIYSMLYNGAYMLPEMIFTVIGAVALFKVPQTKAIISED